MKLLDPKTHGYLDYAGGALLIMGPALFGFMDDAASKIAIGLGVFHLAMSAATKYPLGIFKAVPFTVHEWIELLSAFGLVLMPWVAGFAYDTIATRFYVASGIGLTAVWVLTDYRTDAAGSGWAAHHGMRLSAR